MSAYGSYNECSNGKCICSNCTLRGIKCGPCTDCIGVASETLPPRDRDNFDNGYATTCTLYKGRDE